MDGAVTGIFAYGPLVRQDEEIGLERDSPLVLTTYMPRSRSSRPFRGDDSASAGTVAGPG
jgi:hypothetical protein